jgi:putative ABC transport system permease protein
MPDWARHIRPRLSSLRLAPAREDEIVEELSQHLEDRWRELTAVGATPEEATRLALSEFREGNRLARYMAPLQQAQAPLPITPGAPSGHLLEDLRQDLRYAQRTLSKQPAFAVTAVLTLALGLGSNAAMFSLINAVLLRPLPYPDSQQLVSLYTRYLPSTGYDFRYFALSGPEFADIQHSVDGFAGLAAYRLNRRNLNRGQGDAERVLAMAVTPAFFDVLGVRPERGRTFTEDDARPSAGCVALVGHDASGTSDSAVGSIIRLDDAPCEVIGALPAEFGFRDDRVRVWTALAIDAAETPENRQSHGLAAVARRRDGVSPERVDAQLQSLRGHWSEKFPDHYAKGHFAVTRPLHEDQVGDQRDALLLLGAAVVSVLLIVCVNLAGLLVTNGEARRREFAVRHALGADRGRVVRQLVAEAMLLATTGGAVGLLLAKALLVSLLTLYPQRLPAFRPITIDSAAVLYTGAMVVVAGFLVGLAPALSATGSRLQDTLRVDSRTATGSRRAVGARSLLVIGQLAMSMILLVGAVLLIRSYVGLQQVELGIEPDHVLTFGLSVPPGGHPDPAEARRTLIAIEERLASTPGVDTAGAVSDLPLFSAGPPDDFVIEGRPKPPPGTRQWNARYQMATPRMFRALGIPLRRGRLLADGDVSGRPLVAVINETAARLYWPGEDPIGRTIHYYPEETSPSIQIIGIAGDVRSISASEAPPPVVYVPLAQAPRPPYEGRSMTFVVRVSGNPAAAVASARAAVASIDPGLPLANVRPMSDVVAAAAGQPRFTTLVASFFAGAAFLLAAVGLYGILAYSVRQRIREIGVRMALGAGRREIFRLIIGDGMLLATVGVLVGLPAALASTRLMRGVLAGITTTDPLSYVAVVAMLLTSALLASYLPARQATRVDPLVALRTE